ncbi:hypothetical protein BH11MYX4_BH11MYX4_12280 [soil metagenome]
MRLFTLAAAALLVAAGCSVVAGVDFGSAHDRVDPAASGEGGLDELEGGVAEVPDAAPTGCTAAQKTCNGACVSKDDPAYGCGASDCLPCSVAFAKNATCKAGSCAADTCAAGHGDCDGDPANGCEASLSSPTSCVDCNTKCQAGAALCAPTGCVSSCPGTLTECSGACIDTKSNLDHCGSCGRKCAAPANGDPVCLNGTCTFACRTGFGDCVDNPAKACNPLPKWYRDQDGDGVGGASSVLACAPPAGHVAPSGDCLDTNNLVFPGQPASFGTSFTNAAGVESYDYDCSGVEVDAAEHFANNCAGLCDAYGNVPRSPARAGAGVNPYCGSTSLRSCIDNRARAPGTHVMSVAAPTLNPYCIQSSMTTAPVPCR